MTMSTLHLIGLLSALCVIASGVYVMARGDWKKFALKYAAVCLSTVAAMWFTAYLLINQSDMAVCRTDVIMCLTGDLYHIARNLAFILFHVSVGRDAIRYKHRDRRGARYAR